MSNYRRQNGHSNAMRQLNYYRDMAAGACYGEALDFYEEAIEERRDMMRHRKVPQGTTEQIFMSRLICDSNAVRFYQVVKRTAKMVTVRQIKGLHDWTFENTDWTCKPNVFVSDELIMRRVLIYDGQEFIRIDSSERAYREN